MLIFPAIDLKDGKVVRLHKGDFATVHSVAEDPLVVAQDFYNAGCRYLHMVDLDGAKDGQRKNSHIVSQLTDMGLKVELGGGIRTMADIEAVFALGVWRVVIGSAAVSNPELVREAVARYGGDRVAVGVDTQNGRVKTAGWVEDSGLDYLDFARSMEALGVTNLIFTDIDTDGTLSGPAYGRLEQLQKSVNCRITASGGVAVNEDICRLAEMGLYGAIIGKAYYAGTLELPQAVQDAGEQEVRV